MRVRMAPSPTGPLHIGTARTSLYNFLAARHAGRHLRAAHRGHRPRSQHRRLRARHHRQPALARDHLGRGSAGRRRRGYRSARALSPEPAVRALRSRGRSAARGRGGVSVLVHAGGARGGQTRAVCEQAAAAVQPALPEPDRCGAGRDDGRARPGSDPLQGRAGDDPLRRPHPRRGRVRQRAARRLRHRPQRRDPALPLHGRHRRRGDGDHATSCAARIT